MPRQVAGEALLVLRLFAATFFVGFLAGLFATALVSAAPVLRAAVLTLATPFLTADLGGGLPLGCWLLRSSSRARPCQRSFSRRPLPPLPCSSLRASPCPWSSSRRPRPSWPCSSPCAAPCRKRFFASASTALALRFTLAFAARALRFTEVRVLPASRLALEAAASTFLISETPTSCVLSLAASTASPILVIKLFCFRIIDSPVCRKNTLQFTASELVTPLFRTRRRRLPS